MILAGIPVYMVKPENKFAEPLRRVPVVYGPVDCLKRTALWRSPRRPVPAANLTTTFISFLRVNDYQRGRRPRFTTAETTFSKSCFGTDCDIALQSLHGPGWAKARDLSLTRR